MKEFGIPTAEFGVVSTLAEANTWIDSHPDWAGYVLKLSGPALGKGVIVVHSARAAKDAAQAFFHHRPAGIEDGVLIEEIIPGREVSLFYACDGKQGRFIASACDHKRLLDHDEGPNTGGMGAYSPCHWIDPQFLNSVEEEIVGPTLFGMNKRGTPFAGMLFLGLMVNAKGFSLLEYNTRFGDPETQAFLPIFSGNLSEMLFASATGKLAALPKSASHPQKFSLHVVKAARGYPGVFGEAIETGQLIEGTDSQLTDAHLFYAGVKEDGSKLLSSGGRVLGITGIGSTFQEAKLHAYDNIHRVSFSGEQFRTDIGGAS
jgi:phosphoribosylamine--glycine ligase